MKATERLLVRLRMRMQRSFRASALCLKNDPGSAVIVEPSLISGKRFSSSARFTSLSTLFDTGTTSLLLHYTD